MAEKDNKKKKVDLKAAMLADIVAKPRRVTTFEFNTGETEAFIKFQALPSKEYDDLMSEHPPTKQQRADGMTFNGDTFFPELTALCAIEPTLTKAEVQSIAESDAWSFGELNSLFSSVLNVNTFGAGASFT